MDKNKTGTGGCSLLNKKFIYILKNQLAKKILACETCIQFLPNKPKPIFQFNENSRILIIGQAPGQKVHDAGIPFLDKSGETLRRWLGVTEEQFYTPSLFAIVPMGFCYPGKGKTGDLPPRPECAPQWHEKILKQFKHLQLTLLIGTYAQNYYLQGNRDNLTDTVKNYKKYLPAYFPLVHPSPLNFRWQAKNPWFESEVIPVLQKKVKKILIK